MVFDSLYYDHISTPKPMEQSIERHEVPVLLADEAGVAVVSVLLRVYNSGMCADLIELDLGFVDLATLDCLEDDVIIWMNENYKCVDVQIKFPTTK